MPNADGAGDVRRVEPPQPQVTQQVVHHGRAALEATGADVGGEGGLCAVGAQQIAEHPQVGGGLRRRCRKG
ncbi:hypothetical protein [Sinosporangium album]|uniref:hypothetical protein n=1 Tax=Sinosporangium album TaxID=504805 RepID=UPI00115FBA3E|nr:hypothetical protein [Sinosporangium album]